MATGFVGGAAIGFAAAGPAGALGGGIGGAVLWPFVQWVRGLPNVPAPSFRPSPADLLHTRNNLRPKPPIPAPSFRPAPGDLLHTRGNLRQAPPVAPYVAPPSVADQMLAAGKLNLRQAPPVAPYVAPPSVADQMLAAGKLNLRQAPPLAPYAAPPSLADQMLTARGQNLRHVAAPTVAPATSGLSADWGFNKPHVVALAKQTRGKTLAEMIKLPKGVTTGQVLYRVRGNPVPANTVLSVGAHTVFYRYAAPTQAGVPFLGPIYQTVLHVKPSVDDLMLAMGFQSRGWRWELAWGHHGTLNRDFHLSVPKASQYMPERMDNLADILTGLFPVGEQAMSGTHMTIECRHTAGMSNAAYFLSGDSKYPQGYTQSEGQQFVNACKGRLLDWKSHRLANLKSALATL